MARLSEHQVTLAPGQYYLRTDIAGHIWVYTILSIGLDDTARVSIMGQGYGSESSNHEVTLASLQTILTSPKYNPTPAIPLSKDKAATITEVLRHHG